MGDRDPVVAAWCATQLAARFGWQPTGAGPRLLGSARAAVRAFALEHLDDDLLPREVLRGMLADRSGMVRAVARWRWARAGQDPGPVDRELLTAPRPRPGSGGARRSRRPWRRLPAGGGLAVPGASESAGQVRRRARGGPAQPARRPARPALPGPAGRIGQGSGGRPAVPARVPAGARGARGTGRGGHAAVTADRAGDQAAAEPLGPGRRRPGAAIGDPDPELARTGRADLLSWLRRDAATAYGRPSAEQAALIAPRLAASPLTSEQRREVAFVTGIRPEPPG